MIDFRFLVRFIFLSRNYNSSFVAVHHSRCKFPPNRIVVTVDLLIPPTMARWPLALRDGTRRARRLAAEPPPEKVS